MQKLLKYECLLPPSHSCYLKLKDNYFTKTYSIVDLAIKNLKVSYSRYIKLIVNFLIIDANCYETYFHY